MVLAATLAYKFAGGNKTSWKAAIIYGVIYTIILYIGFILLISIFGLSGPFLTFNRTIVVGYLLMFTIAYFIAKYHNNHNKLGDKEIFKVALWTVLLTIALRSTFTIIGIGTSGFLFLIGVG